MRFEIGPGGGFVILVGLLGLSAAVFFLGMISGREMAQTEQGQAQLASVYPAPAAAPVSDNVAPAQPQPATAPASVPAAPPPPPAAIATPQPPAQAAVASTETAPPAPVKPRYKPPTPARRALASIPSHRALSTNEDTSTDSSADEADAGVDEKPASPRPASFGGHRHGYNIVIDAAMDRASASRMYSRLLALGYTSRVVPTQINGQTWYKVQVGPYPSAEDARAAQDQLRAAYTSRFINHAAPSSASAAQANTDSGDTSDDSAPSD
jgi:DedD protein